MYKNFLKLATRNLWRFRIYSLINLIGLALGLAVGIMILLYVVDELSFDKFHSKADRIFKITTGSENSDGLETSAWPIGYKLRTEFPEVEAVVYNRRAPSNFMINHDSQRFGHDIFFAGEEFFQIFSFNTLEGNAATALRDPYSIVITEEMKSRYIGQGSAIGQTLLIRDTLEFTITAVVENVPARSHIQFDMLASFSTFERLTSWFSYSEGWGNFNVRNYVLLKEGADLTSIEPKARNLYADNVGEWLKEMGKDFYVNFIPLKEVYLNSSVPNGFGPKGSMSQIYLVSSIALFVIFLACINFINLTTARGIYRAREVGLRKIVGSSRLAIVIQFLAESLVLTLVAFGLAILLIDLALPLFNGLMEKEYHLSSLFEWRILAGSGVLILLVTLLSGYYPAWVLSGYKPAEVLKGRMQAGRMGSRLRRTLVVFQFFISTLLVLGTLIVLRQLDYMRNQDLGFTKEQIIVLDATNVPLSASHKAFKTFIKSLSSIEEVSYANATPGRPGWQGQWAYPGEISGENHVDTEYMAIDEGYIGALGLELVAGKNFDPEVKGELDEGLIINETTVKKMGWSDAENALGKKITSPSQHPAGIVIGVVRDYHGQGLQSEIWPKVMDFSSEHYGRYYLVRFNTGSTSDLVVALEKGWKQNLGDYAFEYFFLDEDFDRQYRAEDRLMRVLVIFAILAMIIAGFGLLGLVSFMVLSKTREIGIRKVLGANAFGITALLSREFVILVILANTIAIPIVWYFGSLWISTFAYHTSLSPIEFLMTAGTTIFLALITVSFQTIKAAIMDPVETLRTE